MSEKLDLDHAKARIDQAHTHVCDIAGGLARWKMTIPAHEETDSDLLLADALELGLAAIAEVRKLREQVALYAPIARPIIAEAEWSKRRAERLAAHTHYCWACSDGSAKGEGCLQCRQTGYEQIPCVDCPGPQLTAPAEERQDLLPVAALPAQRQTEEPRLFRDIRQFCRATCNAQVCPTCSQGPVLTDCRDHWHKHARMLTEESK